MYEAQLLDPISFLAEVAACTGDNEIPKLVGPTEGMRHNVIVLKPQGLEARMLLCVGAAPSYLLGVVFRDAISNAFWYHWQTAVATVEAISIH
jgi:hypothetical protein